MAIQFPGMPDYGQLLGLDQQPDPRLLAQQQQQIDMQRQQQQAALQQAQQKILAQEAYNNDIRGLLSKPNASPADYADFIARHPEQAEGIKSSFELRDKAAQASDFKDLTRVYGLAAAGQVDAAKQVLQGRIDAAKAGGGDPTESQQILDVLNADPAKARGYLGYLMASIGGNDKFAAIQEQLRLAQGGGDPFTLGAGEIRYDANGNVIASSPFRPQLVTGPNGEIIEYRPGGGGTAPGTGGLTGNGRYKNGWAPRERNGGDNTDAQVDNYIAHVAGKLGISSDTPITAANLPAIASAMADFESGGKPNAISVRNNNPGNIRKNGQFVKYPTLAAGQAAQRDLLGKYLARGQNTIRSIIEGVPVNPSQANSGDSSTRVIADGKRPAARMTPEEVAAEKLDPSVVYYRNKDGIPQAVSGQTKQTAARQIPDSIVKRLQPQIDIRDTMSRLTGNFRNDFAGNNLTGGMENTIQSVFSGFGTPGQRDWWADFQSMDNQVRNQLFGSALTENEKRAYEATTIAPGMDPKIVRQNLERRKRIVDAALARQQSFLKRNRYDADAVDALFEPLTSSAPASGGWGRARRVN